MAQKGWITKQNRKRKGPVWVYHWYTTRPHDGKTVEHTCVVASVASRPQEKDVWQEVDRRHLQPQPGQTEIRPGRLTFADLAASYQQNGMRRLAETTQYTVKHAINRYLLPRWGERYALDIQPLEIEQWLRSLKLANPTKEKLRRTMNVVYTQAQRYGLLPRNEGSNPVHWVQQSAKSSYRPVVVEPATAARIVETLSGVERTLTVLVAVTGLRISEALGLRWEDIDYAGRQIHLRRSWVNETVVEQLKTDASSAAVPLSDGLAGHLKAWHRETVYSQPTDWVFASKKNRGRTPRSGSVLVADHLRPAAVAAGVRLQPGQRFGFHNLRHSLATYLVNKGMDVKTVQGLLRHSNVTTTLGLYAHSVDATKLAAQAVVLQAMKGGPEAGN